MRSIKKGARALVPVVALASAVFSVIGGADDLAAFQRPGGSLFGSSETCALTAQLTSDSYFRQRYTQKIVSVQNGTNSNTDTELSSVEEMYSNVKEVSLFSLDDDTNNKPLQSFGVEVDALSIDCLSCHDGSRASNVTINLRNDPFKRFSTGLKDAAADHPIGMEYARYSGRDYKPVFNGGKMIFVNGKVGCLTCHDPFNKDKGHLVMSDRGSQLCLTCHDR